MSPKPRIKNHSKSVFLWLLLAATVFLSGCATYNQRFNAIANNMARGDINAALEALEKTKGAERDTVLYLLNRGTLLRMKGDYAASNAAFEEAKLLIEQLDAVSVSEQAGALSVNDGMRSYTGEDYERVLLHIYKALNYLEMGEPQKARVEALQVDVQLQVLKDSDTNAEEFARYFTGIIFEDLGEWDNAMIAYRHAYKAYQGRAKDEKGVVPDPLKRDLLRLAQARTLDDELTQYQNDFAIEQWQSLAELQKKGELIFFFLNNLAPVKQEKASHGQDVASGRMVRIAIPYYAPNPLKAAHSKVSVKGQTAKTAVVEDIDALARESLNDAMAGIIARAIARAVVKHKTSKKLSEKNGTLGAVVNIAGVLSERADTRSWSTLPHNIQLTRLSLQPGTYDLDVEVVDRNGRVIGNKRFTGVEVKAGEKVYRSYHWVAP